MVVLMTFLWRKSRVGTETISRTTERMQAMLLRALLVQAIVGTLFIVLPMSTAGMALFLGRSAPAPKIRR